MPDPDPHPDPAGAPHQVGEFLDLWRPSAAMLDAIAAEPTDTVEAMADRPGWLRICANGATTIVDACTVVGVTRGPGDQGTHLMLAGGADVGCGAFAVEDTLAMVDAALALAIDRSEPAPPAMPTDLGTRVAARRTALEVELQDGRPDEALACNPKLAEALGWLREQAMAFAPLSAYPHDVMLLVRDAAMEAAKAALDDDNRRDGETFLAFARQLERDAKWLPLAGDAA